MGNPNGLVYLNGERMTMAEADAQPSRLPFNLADHERGRTADQLWESAIGDLRAMVEQEGQAAWLEIVRKYDQFSLYEFLREKGWSEGAIEYYAVMNFLEADMHNAVVEILREDIGKAYVDMQEIAGGMDRLPNAFFGELHREVHLGAEVFAIDQEPGSVVVHYKTEAGRYRAVGDYAVCTVPFSVLRTIETVQPFSHEKRRAIRQLNYHASTKIVFQVRQRIWEKDDGIVGGATVTDLPVRRLNYPTPDPIDRTRRPAGLLHLGPGRAPVGRDGRGDAPRGGARRRGPHPSRGSATCTRSGASHAWYSDRWARGAFAMFAPEQQTELQPAIVQPEGRVLFAGEHCSLYHAWIQGALESGIRAARQIHEATDVAEGTGIASA